MESNLKDLQVNKKEKVNKIKKKYIINDQIKNKQFLVVKIPANVENPQKAIDKLGGEEKILNKVKIKI
jgi:hypothetical protein